jgi:hypothetical protein
VNFLPFLHLPVLIVSIEPSCFAILGSPSKREVCFLIFYLTEMRYSLVDGKNIVSPENPAVKDNVTLKDGQYV